MIWDIEYAVAWSADEGTVPLELLEVSSEFVGPIEAPEPVIVTLERKLLLDWLEVDFPLPETASLAVTEGVEPRVKVEVDELSPTGGVRS